MVETPFPIVNRYTYPALTATTFETGGRVYEIPTGKKVPSVTTILSTLPKDGLIAWRERIGNEKADNITAEACRVGSTMHEMLEGYVGAYLRGQPNIPPVTEEDHLAHRMAENIKRFGLIDLDEVWGIEEALYCAELYAGRTDLIGVYRGKSAIIDYKSTKRWKKAEWLESYKMQLAAYNFCHKFMFGEGLESGVILMAVRPPCREPLQMIVLDQKQLDYWEEKWLCVMENFHESKLTVPGA